MSSPPLLVIIIIIICCRSNPVCRVIPTPDQDLTDFSKALKEVSAPRYFESFDQVVAFVEHTGRLDQIFANIETLFHAKRLLRRDPEDKEPKPVFLVSSSSLTWLLDSGTHKILLPSSG